MAGAEQELLLTGSRYAVAIVAGLVAGVINTLAGNGSAITLPVLMFLGLDANTANGTNRIGVALSSLTGASTFRRSGLLETKGIGWLIGPAAIGAVVGALIAARLDPNAMKFVIGVVMVIMLILVLLKPKRWIRQDSVSEANHRTFPTVAIFFLIGVHGGFIQAGVGILLLSALVLRAGYNLVRANPIKIVIVLTFTIPALAIFIRVGQVNWSVGLIMAIGQVTGAYLAAKFAANHPRANIWIRRLLIVMIVAFLVKLFVF